ncbi:hypothetical protein RHGRI_037572 [Rhododendron griersonianum]|uniref:Trafficking protein particle complex subunit 13 C-terminal domain-containing protein n=1 Tax=Rhododendron griersonianum TaxID=479676 RepID=A0AAV6HTA8_9ERIC|nr:hypothetical protein RHGRI_037572 [Rhododendron griersonianum]
MNFDANVQALPQVEAYSSTIFQLNLIATRLGVQKITGITVFDTTEKRTYDSLSDLEIFVDSDQLVKSTMTGSTLGANLVPILDAH